jgi:hypothetical protein
MALMDSTGVVFYNNGNYLIVYINSLLKKLLKTLIYIGWAYVYK